MAEYLLEVVTLHRWEWVFCGLALLFSGFVCGRIFATLFSQEER